MRARAPKPQSDRSPEEIADRRSGEDTRADCKEAADVLHLEWSKRCHMQRRERARSADALQQLCFRNRGAPSLRPSPEVISAREMWPRTRFRIRARVAEQGFWATLGGVAILDTRDCSEMRAECRSSLDLSRFEERLLQAARTRTPPPRPSSSGSETAKRRRCQSGVISQPCGMPPFSLPPDQRVRTRSP